MPIPTRSKRGRRLGKRAAQREARNRVACSDLCQLRARTVGVFAHLGGERVRRGERCIGAQKFDELDVDLLTVEVAVKVEQVGFENGLPRAESGTDADIACGVMAAWAVIDAHGGDAGEPIL